MPRFDENDVEAYDRPRRHTRPRTKERPTYDDAVDGRVVTVDRGRYTTLVEGRTVLAMKSRPLGRKGVVVGDEVRLVGDVTGDDGSLARIVEVGERRSVLRRTADDDDPVERVIVANADQLVVVTALADPEPRTGLIDRALVAALDAGLDPLLCLTKADLASPESLVSIYRPLGVPWVVTQRGQGLDELHDRLAGKVSVLIGHSGVGKSTLVNALVPGSDRAIGIVNAHTGRGRHTSTSAVMLELRTAGEPAVEVAAQLADGAVVGRRGHVVTLRVDADAARQRLDVGARLGDRRRAAERLLVHVAEMREVEQVVADERAAASRSAGARARSPTRASRTRSCRAGERGVGLGPARPSRRTPTCLHRHRIALHARLLGDVVGARDLDAAAGRVEEQAVVAAANAVAFLPALLRR